MTINISPVTPRSFSKKLAMIAAANILRIGVGLATATSANPVGRDAGFPAGSHAGGSDHATATARDRQVPMPAVVARPGFG
jgi:hypothetical protein